MKIFLTCNFFIKIIIRFFWKQMSLGDMIGLQYFCNDVNIDNTL